MTQPFQSARTKLARSVALTDEFERTIAGFKGAVLRSEVEGADLCLLVRLTAPVPEVATILGDAIHNLRAALDYAAVSVVSLNGRSTKGVAFPFAENAEDLPEQIKRRKFHRASPEAVALLTSLRPYHGGDAVLRGLHDLDNLDKHNDLIPLFAGAVQKQDLQIAGLFLSGATFNLKEGSRVMLVRGGAALAIPDTPLGQTALFPFGNDMVFSGKEVVPTLNSLAQLVGGIIDAFEALSLREGAKLSAA